MELHFHPGPPDYGQRNCPKNVAFHAKLRKFVKLVHLVVFFYKRNTVVALRF